METPEERLADANDDPDPLLESAGRYKDDPSWDFVMESIRRHRAEIDAELDELDAPPLQARHVADEKSPAPVAPEPTHTCHECGGTMTRDIRPMTVNYDGLSATFDMPGWYCGECGEGVHSGKDMEASDRQLNLMKAQIENLTLPSEVRRIRKKLGLNQQAAGTLLGGGPNAFHKYESGEVLPSKATSNLLRVLEAIPEGLKVLREWGAETAAL